MTSLKERFILRAAMLLMALCPLSSFAFSHELRQLLDSLDDAVARRQTALAKKQQVIDDLKRGITDLPNDGALVAKYEQIFQEYLHFNGDSALAYAKRSVVAAEHTGQPALILTAKFCLLRAYTRQGLLGKGYEVINSIGDINAVPAVYRSRYADHLLDFYMRVSQQNDFTVPAQDAKAAWGTYSQYLVNGSPEYLFYQAVCTGKGDKRRINQALRMLNKPSFLVANLYFALALDERRRGNENGFYENLILSAVNDMLL